MMPNMLIRKAEIADARAVAAIILPTIREGATYALDSDLSEVNALAYWMGSDKETFVAEDEGEVVAPTTCVPAALTHMRGHRVTLHGRSLTAP
jgi:hypothetical protein